MTNSHRPAKAHSRPPLPTPISSFVGRRAELNAIVRALSTHRLVTLTGAGGCGKTRLALQAAHEWKPERDEHGLTLGAVLVDLAAVDEDNDVARATARALGVREEHERPVIDTLADTLRHEHALLLLDNCEQVLVGCASLAQALLHAAPDVRVLATSREPLGVDGECTWRVPSMDSATGCELFLERARAVTASAHDTDTAVSRIVERVDGLPLAIELAAARTRVMSPAQILDSLDDRFRLLTGGSRLRLPRQQTLEASVAWSYDLLEPREQLLARRLCVLHRFDLPAAQAMGRDATLGDRDVLELLTRLCDKSLLLAEPWSGEVRYRFTETVRQFLLARLQQSGELHAVRERHLHHFVATAESLAPHLASGNGPRHLAQLQADLDNLDDALGWAEATGNTTAMLRLVVALSLFFELGGQLAHGARWFARALVMNRDDGSPFPDPTVSLRARALWGQAHVAFYGGHYELAAASATESIALAKAHSDTWAEARALNTLGVLQSLSVPDEARVSLMRSLAMGRVNGDHWAEADGWKMITVSWYVQHDELAAEQSMRELRQAGSALGSHFFLAWHEAMLGYFASGRGDYALARAAFERAEQHSRLAGDPSTGGFVECWSAALDAHTGDMPRARERLARLLETASRTGSELALPEALYAMARVLLANDEWAETIALVEPHVSPLRKAGIPSWATQLLLVLAAANRQGGNLPSATAALDQAWTLIGAFGNTQLTSLVHYERALVAHAGGDHARTVEQLHVALALQHAQGLRPDAVRTLEALARTMADTESDVECVRLLSTTTAIRSAMGLVHDQGEAAVHQALCAASRGRLGDALYDETWSLAAALTLDDAVELVTRARGARKRPTFGWQSLTPTERRVVELVAEGLSNPQIAERMFIARGTVKVHLAHVFTKLEVNSRAQLAAMAVARRDETA